MPSEVLTGPEQRKFITAYLPARFRPVRGATPAVFSTHRDLKQSPPVVLVHARLPCGVSTLSCKKLSISDATS